MTTVTKEFLAEQLKEINDRREADFKAAIQAKIREIVVTQDQIRALQKTVASKQAELGQMSYEPVSADALG
jgi:translation elongation factor EF-4